MAVPREHTKRLVKLIEDKPKYKVWTDKLGRIVLTPKKIAGKKEDIHKIPKRQEYLTNFEFCQEQFLDGLKKAGLSMEAAKEVLAENIDIVQDAHRNNRSTNCIYKLGKTLGNRLLSKKSFQLQEWENSAIQDKYPKPKVPGSEKYTGISVRDGKPVTVLVPDQTGNLESLIHKRKANMSHSSGYIGKSNYFVNDIRKEIREPIFPEVKQKVIEGLKAEGIPDKKALRIYAENERYISDITNEKARCLDDYFDFGRNLAQSIQGKPLLPGAKIIYNSLISRGLSPQEANRILGKDEVRKAFNEFTAPVKNCDFQIYMKDKAVHMGFFQNALRKYGQKLASEFLQEKEKRSKPK